MKLQTKLTLSLLPLVLVACAQKSQKPNIIFFLMDDLGYGELGCFGQQKIETPNIDNLAANGKILTQHYSGQTVSAPSRAVLMTGQHTGHTYVRGNDEFGARGNVWSHQAMLENSYLEGQGAMPKETRTMAHMLQEAGYETACIGKWGLGYPGSDSEPNKMGFDYFYGYNCQRQAHSYYPTHLYENRERVYLDNKVLQPGKEKLDKGADPRDLRSYDKFNQKEYAPDLMFDATIDFMEENKDKPFFIWWTTPLPHVALQAPEELVQYYVDKFGDEEPYIGNRGYFPSRYPRATYAAMVTYVDNQVGEIVKKLKEDGIYDNTIIVFTSDNGPSYAGGTDCKYFDSAAPFNSDYGYGKTALREGGIRVPTIIKWDAVVEPNTKSDYISSFSDWMPTFAEIIDVEANENIDGVSLMRVLEGKKGEEREFLYWEFPEGKGAVAVRQGDWKLLVENLKKEPRIMLFNLKIDPTEKIDIAKENPEKVKELMEIVKQEHVKPENARFDMPMFFDNL